MKNHEPFAVELQSISKQYVIDATQVTALRDVSLQLEPGSLVAVTGKSGAGKSTLLHIIGTLDRPSSGNLLMGGLNVSSMNDADISRFRNSSIGFVFQMNNLLPEFTALENVMMPGIISGLPRSALKARGTDLLGQVGLGQRMGHRPSELSGGEQQRVAIARALLMAPPIILADEPTGNLDRKTSHAIQDLLIELAKQHQMTLILVTHDLELAARLPRQVVMEDGSVISDGVI
jgi:lipoprotein-releasing system ATP-binding protein